MTPLWFRPESVTWAVDPRRHRDGMIEERSAIGGSSEVEGVECWMGLREAIQRASKALQGQPGIWVALLREAGGVQRCRRRATLMWMRLGWRTRCGLCSCCRGRRAMYEVPGDGGMRMADRQDAGQRVKGGRGVVRMRRLRRCGGHGHRLGLSEASLWVGEAGVGLLGAPVVSDELSGLLRIRVCGLGRSRDACASSRSTE